MMNFWTPTNDSWGHNFSTDGMPFWALYDYVEAYTWTGFGSSFDLLWRDDFDTFDENRWIKSEDWSFNDNSSTFYSS